MGETLMGRLKHAWNAFLYREKEPVQAWDYGASYSFNPNRMWIRTAGDKTIVGSVYNRMANDVADTYIRHVRLDENDRFLEEIKSSLNECLKVEANIDQEPRAFLLDYAQTLFDKGVVAIVPVETTKNPDLSEAYDVKQLRVAEIVDWYPQHVRVRAYNQTKGIHEELVVSKRWTPIVENPFYSIMNERNSTLQRLLRKLSLLDAVDEQSSSNRLDIIIQLPYVIKSEARRAEAEKRRKDIELQLKGSQYGIAYTDGTEKITQLNRPTENNLLKQVEYLTNMLYGQLGLTPEILNGTADEKAMLNYMNRTIAPLVQALTEAMKAKFLSKTARSQGQSIQASRDPFKFVPLASIAEIADKFTRNEILSANEIRTIIGFRPSKDPKADELRNSNMPQQEQEPGSPASTEPESPTEETEEAQEGQLQNGV